MSKKIKPEDLQSVLKDYLENYKEAIDKDVVEVTDDITRQAKQELVNTSPRGKGKRDTPYYRGWAIKLSKRRTGQYHKVIWNKTNYQLTHLLEFGHTTRNGGRTRAIPHIRPVEEKYNVEFVDLLEKKIRRTSK